MADKITFTSAVLRSFGRDHKAGHASFSAALSDGVMKALGITDVPECLKGADFGVELHTTAFELIPSEKELAKHGFDLDISRAGGFKVTRLEIEGRRGKGYRQELRFNVTFPDKNGCKKLEQYINTIGEAKGRLSISYTKQEVIADGVEATDEQRQATLEAED